MRLTLWFQWGRVTLSVVLVPKRHVASSLSWLHSVPSASLSSVHFRHLQYPGDFHLNWSYTFIDLQSLHYEGGHPATHFLASAFCNLGTSVPHSYILHICKTSHKQSSSLVPRCDGSLALYHRYSGLQVPLLLSLWTLLLDAFKQCTHAAVASPVQALLSTEPSFL